VSYVAGGLIGVVLMWGVMALLLRLGAKSGVTFVLSKDPERARAIQDRQAQVALKLWPLAVVLLFVALVLIVI